MSGKRGRPTVYTQAIADEICERLADGEALITICKPDHMPADSSVIRWSLEDHPDRPGFLDKYAKAREAQAYRWAEQVLAISDNPQQGVRYELTPEGVSKEIREDMLGHRRLQVDSRKWLLSKLLPKRFGDKVTQEHTGDGGGPVIYKWQD